MPTTLPLDPPSSRKYDPAERWPWLRQLDVQKIAALTNRPQLGFDVLRIYLGMALMVRGALFLREPAVLSEFINHDSWLGPMVLAHGVVLTHLVGGLLLAAGCYTRLAAALQIPALAGAVFFVHLYEGLLSRGQSLELAALVLVALVSYAIFGSGPLSVDNYLARAPSQSSVDPAKDISTPPPERSASALGKSEPVGDVREGVDVTAQPDSPEVSWLYHDAKLELSYVLVVLTAFFVLLAEGLYMWGGMWFIAGLMIFGVWRIGRARLD